MPHTRHAISTAAGVLALLMTHSSATAQSAPARIHHKDLNVASGAYDGRPGAIEGEMENEIAFFHVFTQEHAPWMRLHLSDFNLGNGSYIILRSLRDGGQQRLDSISIEDWQHATAIFNGDSVMLELHVAPQDKNVFVTFDQAIYGDPEPNDGGIATACGADNRVNSGDNRVGRLYFGGCTAWRTTSGVFLTAGHCVDFDPDDSGPAVPNGVLDLSGVVEFNVPASNSNGSTNAADPDDQYPILTNNVAWQFAGEGNNSVGTDWAAFKVGPNSNTGLTPAQAYGLPFRLTRETPAGGATTRITGFGSDGGVKNFTNQTSTGPFDSEDVINANQVQLHYQVDTEGGNSGSPVIWESLNLAFGIHTNAGCQSDGGGYNSGTSMEQDVLETWISVVAAAPFGVAGANIRYVDVNHPLRVAESGTPYRPYSTFNLGASGVPNGGIVSIVAGTYSSTGTYGTGNKAMLLIAPVGTVTIGQ